METQRKIEIKIILIATFVSLSIFIIFWYIFSQQDWLLILGGTIFILLSMFFVMYPYYILLIFLSLLPYFFQIEAFSRIGYIKGPAILVAAISIPALITKFKLKIKVSEMEILLLLFILGNAISLLTLNVPENALLHFLLFVGNAILYIMVVTFVNSWRKVKYIIFGMIVMYSISAYIAIMQKRTLLFTRTAGTMKDPNLFALMLLPVIIFSIFLFFYYKNIFVKIGLLFSILLLLGGIVSTVSRSALITLFVGIFLIFTQKKKIPLFILLLIPVIIYVFYIKPRWLQLGYQAEEIMGHGRMLSVTMRWELLVASIKMFIEHPIIGVGPGNFIYLEYLYDVPYKLFAHNTYMEIATGSGIVGLFPFLGLLYVSLRNYYKVYKFWKNRDTTKMTIAIALLVGTFVYYFDIMFLSMEHSSLLWTLMALSTVVVNLTLNDVKSRNRTGQS